MQIQISSGKGPVECELAVGRFLSVITTEFPDIQIMEAVHGKYADCYKSILISSKEDLKCLVGTVKWIVQSPFRPKHKRKNWFIDISIIEEKEQITWDEKIVRFETFRCGGHGGQNVNKVETGVRAIHVTTGISVVCTEARTQHMNKKLAVTRLAEIIGKQNIKSDMLAQHTMWLQHELIERGNQVRVYEGMDFKRIQ